MYICVYIITIIISSSSSIISSGSMSYCACLRSAAVASKGVAPAAPLVAGCGATSYSALLLNICRQLYKYGASYSAIQITIQVWRQLLRSAACRRLRQLLPRSLRCATDEW